jgi:hypothetical protein
MWETFFGFKKTPFSDCPDARQMFSSAAWLVPLQRFEAPGMIPLLGMTAWGARDGDLGLEQEMQADSCTPHAHPAQISDMGPGRLNSQRLC